MDDINRARANGKLFAGSSTDEYEGSVRYMHDALAHNVRLALTEAERRGGMAAAYLEALVRAQDAGGLIAQL
jgi:hypothetical protein